VPVCPLIITPLQQQRFSATDALANSDSRRCLRWPALIKTGSPPFGCAPLQLMESDDLQDFDAAAKSVHSSVLISPATMTRPGTAVDRSSFVTNLRSTSASQRRPSSAILGANQHAATCVKVKAALRLTQITVPTSRDIRTTIFPSSPAPFIESKLHVGIANMQPNIPRPQSAMHDESLEAASTVKFVDLCRENDAAGMNPDNLTTPFSRCSRTQLKPALPRPGYVIAPAKMKIVVDLEKAIAVACTSGQGSLQSTEEQLDETKLNRSRAFLKVLKTLEECMPKLETVLSPIAAELEDFFGTCPYCSTVQYSLCPHPQPFFFPPPPPPPSSSPFPQIIRCGSPKRSKDK